MNPFDEALAKSRLYADELNTTRRACGEAIAAAVMALAGDRSLDELIVSLSRAMADGGPSASGERSIILKHAIDRLRESARKA